MSSVKASKAHKQNVRNQINKKYRLKWKDVINYKRRMNYRSRLGRFENGLDVDDSINREKEPPVRRPQVNQPFELTSQEKEIARKKWLKSVQQYEIEIRQYYSHVCNCCGRIMRESQLKKLDRRTLKIEDDVIQKVFHVKKENVSKFCKTCSSYIKKGKIPRVALCNGLDFPKVDKAISALNRIEERLLAPRHVFQSLWTHQGPNGQLKAKGGIVNVPVEIDTSVQALPRKITDSYIIHIRVARRMSYVKDFMSGVVRPKLLYDAAKKFVSKPLPKEEGIKLNMKWKCTSSAPEDYDLSGDEHFVQNAIHETMLTNDKDEQSFCHLMDKGIRIAPAEQYCPKSILFDENCEFLAFPKVFEELTEELRSLQVHHHTHTCYKKFSQKDCRFDIPFFPMMKTTILTPLKTSKKKQSHFKNVMKRIKKIKNQEKTLDMTFFQFLQKVGISYKEYILVLRSHLTKPQVYLKRKPCDMFISPFSVKMVTLMRSNVNLQFVLDAYGAACYIIDYINKSDRGMSNLLRNVLDEIKQENLSLQRRRLKPRTIRYRNYHFELDPENYVREHLMLFHPWKNETRDLINSDTHKLFKLHFKSISKVKKQFNAFDDDTIEKAVSEANQRSEENPIFFESDKPIFDFDEYQLQDAFVSPDIQLQFEDTDLALEVKRWKKSCLTPKFSFLHEETDDLRIMYHNVQSLQKHINLIRNDSNFTSADILIFGETWNTSNDNFKIKNFRLIEQTPAGSSRKPRGVSIYLRKTLMPSLQTTSSSVITDKRSRIDIASMTFNDVTIIGIYAKPNTSLHIWSKFFKNCPQNKKLIIIGDFNINSAHHAKFKPFKHFLDQHQLSLINKRVETTTAKTSLDWIVSMKTRGKKANYKTLAGFQIKMASSTSQHDEILEISSTEEDFPLIDPKNIKQEIDSDTPLNDVLQMKKNRSNHTNSSSGEDYEEPLHVSRHKFLTKSKIPAHDNNLPSTSKDTPNSFQITEDTSDLKMKDTSEQKINGKKRSVLSKTKTETNTKNTKKCQGDSNPNDKMKKLKTSKKSKNYDDTSDSSTDSDSDTAVSHSESKMTSKKSKKPKKCQNDLKIEFKKNLEKVEKSKYHNKNDDSTDSESNEQCDSDVKPKKFTKKQKKSDSDSDTDSHSESKMTSKKSKKPKFKKNLEKVEKSKYHNKNDDSTDSESNEQCDSDVKPKKFTKKQKKSKKSDNSSDSNSDSETMITKKTKEDKRKAKNTVRYQKKNDKYEDSSDSEGDSDSDNYSKKKPKSKKRSRVSKKSKKSNCSENTSTSSDDSTSSSEENSTDDFLSNINENTTKTSRDLKRKKPYKLLKLNITKETGFNGLPYNKAVAVFEHPTKKAKKIKILMPKPVANWNKKTVKEMKKRIQKGKNPTYTVLSIESKKKPSGSGHYDMVKYQWQ
ncbi:Halomucin [Frankliniella fusca]|uniref:Halomucin n=1 Tax=Frankliniella fusca TaxID=407009 RepID=A0AAE1HMR5_9NEOP|nr:Halomucin [Frankliniella fusca]